MAVFRHRSNFKKSRVPRAKRFLSRGGRPGGQVSVAVALVGGSYLDVGSGKTKDAARLAIRSVGASFRPDSILFAAGGNEGTSLSVNTSMSAHGFHNKGGNPPPR